MIFKKLNIVEQPVLLMEFTCDEVDTLRLIFNHPMNRSHRPDDDKILFNCLTDFQRQFCTNMYKIVTSI